METGERVRTSRISVLMCVHNGEEYLREAIQSVLDQTFTDFEFIIVNDASVDQTVPILLSYKDPRIHIVNNENNIGLTKSLNKGLKLATGEFIARMDADDICHKERFKEQIEFLDRNKDIALCGTWVSYDEKENKEPGYPQSHEEIKVTALSYNPFAHPTVMWRRETFESLDLYYNEDFRTSQDFELWSRAVHKVKTANIPISLLFYRQHTGQVSRSKEENQKMNSRRIKLGQLKYLDLYPDERESLAHICLFDGQFSLRRDSTMVKDADEWMYKIVMANRKLKVFKEELLLAFWKSRFFASNMYEYDMAKWRILKNSWCMKYCSVTLKDQLKLFLKCFLQWKVKEE